MNGDKKVIRVKDVMKRKFDMVDGMATVRDAVATMKHVETKCLVVNKRHDDDEYGMLLISDIGRKILALDRAPERLNVYEVMAKPVVSVDEDMDIRYCARLFTRFHLSRCPVLNKSGEVVGIVSYTDMVLKGMFAEIE